MKICELAIQLLLLCFPNEFWSTARIPGQYKERSILRQWQGNKTIDSDMGKERRSQPTFPASVMDISGRVLSKASRLCSHRPKKSKWLLAHYFPCVLAQTYKRLILHNAPKIPDDPSQYGQLTAHPSSLTYCLWRQRKWLDTCNFTVPL